MRGGREGGEGVDEEVEEVRVTEERGGFIKDREDRRAVCDKRQPSCYVVVPESHTQKQSHLQTHKRKREKEFLN